MPELNKAERALFELIQRHIFFLRGMRVILSTHLADIYGIETRVLIQAIKRNRALFPESVLFQLNADEFSALKSHFVISRYNQIRRSLPYALTEQGIVILAGIIRSKRATAINIAIVRIFVHPHRLYLKSRFF